jgi:hypothetical protein
LEPDVDDLEEEQQDAVLATLLEEFEVFETVADGVPRGGCLSKQRK